MADTDRSLQPIGVFDSGVGGLSVLRAIRRVLPEEPVVYFADQAHVPYGPRPLEEVRAFSVAITRFLLEQGAKLIVVACNAASAAALHHLRQILPDIQFVGMEPAIKPAAEWTHSGVVGVLATPATFQGELYASVVERFANGVTLLPHTCPGLVGQIEKGELNTPRTKTILENALRPMLEQGIDTIVLGCTHYPFVIPLIQEIAGPNVRVMDPAPAVARQVSRLLRASKKPARDGDPEEGSGKSMEGAAAVKFYTSGEPGQMERMLPRLCGISATVRQVQWTDDLRIKIKKQT
jgi:glutamate racemase